MAASQPTSADPSNHSVPQVCRYQSYITKKQKQIQMKYLLPATFHFRFFNLSSQFHPPPSVISFHSKYAILEISFERLKQFGRNVYAHFTTYDINEINKPTHVLILIVQI